MGDCPARYPHRDALAADAGQATVANESGKRKTATFSWGTNKQLRRAFVHLPDTTRQYNPWAHSLYTQAIQRDHDHPPDPHPRPRLVPRPIALPARPRHVGPRASPRTATPHHRHDPTESGPVPDLAATRRDDSAAVTQLAARQDRARSA